MSELSSKLLAGKVAVVTGGSSGIGAAIAHRFAAEGVKVAVVASASLAKAQDVASSITGKGHDASAFACDVRDPDKLKSLIQDVEASLGPIGILVNSAGVFYPTPLGQTKLDDFTRMIDINLKGAWLTIDAVAPGMIARKRGIIINIASTAGLIGIAPFSAYCATKAAIVMMTKAMARELAPHGINVNAIAPGNTETPMNEAVRSPENSAMYDGMLAITPSGRVFSSPDEIAGAALFLASPSAKPMHGSVMVLDEGIRPEFSFSPAISLPEFFRKAAMRKSDKVIITCAVTGSVHTPTMSEYLPITPSQIAEQAIAAAEAGAAILHLHARDPLDGKPTPDPEVFMQFLPRIKQATDAVVNITTGGGMGMTIDERLAAPRRAKPELCSLNMGSMNFGVFGAHGKIEEFKYPWEKAYLAQSDDLIASNTFKQIEKIATDLGDNFGTRFEFECYDVGHLYTLEYFVRKGIVKPPFLIQCIFGILGGQGADPENLMHMKQTADRLFGDDYYLSVLGAGRHQTRMVTLGALMGGSVRVGLEDSLYLKRGEMAKSNAEQVVKIRHILEELSLEIATPDEARKMLCLKGADQVGF